MGNAVSDYSVPMGEASEKINAFLQAKLAKKGRSDEYDDPSKKRQFRYHMNTGVIKGPEFEETVT